MYLKSKGGINMFIIALIAALIGSIITAIGKSANSPAFLIAGSIICLASGALFLVNAFSFF